MYLPYLTNKKHYQNIEINREAHIAFLRNALFVPLSEDFISLDASRPWLSYWILHALDLLGEGLEEEEKDITIKTIASYQDLKGVITGKPGGFGGGPRQLAHLATTYASISTLSILESSKGYDIIDRNGLRDFLMRMKQPDGSFTVHHDGETDLRGSYCAMAVASMCNILDDELASGVGEYVSKCQTFEGGFGAVPEAEAHAGYTYCGYATLAILGKTALIDREKLVAYAKRMQCKKSGGFSGRTFKLVDGCYSFWCGALFPMIQSNDLENFHSSPNTNIIFNNENQTRSKNAYNDNSDKKQVDQEISFDYDALQRYLLICSECSDNGGFRDKPGKTPDYYHTCYCLSGLSIAQHQGIVMGKAINVLRLLNPFYNLVEGKFEKMKNYFQIKKDNKKE